ncbi:hypothetical protein [Kitasatospora albolonga]|uniref:aspartate-alanine antiporter-like transporter n=1 Tax=Kitasatospora albolonga TaxID=68173 RepID=UPI0031E6FD0E
MWQFFADNPWVTLFAVIALGSLLGLARLGPVRLGAAGVLFAGLLVGALDPDIGRAVPAGVSVLGLALYVYTVGLESGPAFFRELRPQLAVMAGAVIALVVTAVAVGLLGNKVFGISGPYLAGGYAGIGTTTPGLAAAQAASSDPAQPAVGYAIGYPLAVVVTILFVAGLATVRSWPGRHAGDLRPPRSSRTATRHRDQVRRGRSSARVAAPRPAADGGEARDEQDGDDHRQRVADGVAYGRLRGVRRGACAAARPGVVVPMPA